MKTLVKGLTALLICGSMIGLNVENTEAANLTTDTFEIQELARHHHKPVPPPPPHNRYHDRHRHPYHHDYFWFDPPPPPPSHHRHGGPRPHHRW